MTRRERQDQFSEAFLEWVKAASGPLTLAEVTGIVMVNLTKMTFHEEFEPVDDDEEEGWKKG